MIYYPDGSTPVSLGDEVEIRGGFVLLFRKYVGKIVYVPGASPLNEEMEFNGLQWVAVEIPGKALLRRLVDPETNRLVGSVYLISRGAASPSTIDLSAESDT